MPTSTDLAQKCALLLQPASSSPANAWWWVPLLSAVLAVAGSWIAIMFDRRKSINQELIKKRIALYDVNIPLANQIYCYFTQVGDFRNLTPADILSSKRRLDQFIHIYGPLFSGEEFTEAYFRFSGLCFSEFQGAGINARLRANLDRLKPQFGDQWKQEWESCFDPSKVISFNDLRAAYMNFLKRFADEIGGKR